MAGVEVVIEFNHLQRISQAAAEKAALAVAKATHDVEAQAKATVPMDTGALKNSITSTVSGLSGEVAPHTEYALYVEAGTRKMAARPYMRPAAEKVRPLFLKAMAEIVKG